MIPTMSGRRKLSERDAQETCSQWLALDDWRRLRMDLPHLRGLGVAERGIADDLYIRYLHGARIEVPTICDTKVTVVLKAPAAEALFIEWKSKTGKAAEHQKAWHAQEKARGALVWVAGVDFPKGSIPGFEEWYMNSGLRRKVNRSK